MAGGGAGMAHLVVLKKMRRAFSMPLACLWVDGSSQGRSKSVGWMRARVVTPLRRSWTLFVFRLRFRKQGRGFRNLYDDVQACGYEDVQVMWSMLNHHS